jgi:hypothetical protein
MSPKLREPGYDASRLASITHFVVRAIQRHWQISLALVAIAVAACATIAMGQEAESWTATSTIKIGVAPNPDSLINSNGTPHLEPIENARDLVARVSNPQFKTDVVTRLESQPASQPSSLLIRSSLRGVVFDDFTVRLEVTAASRQEAVSLMQGTILAIQKIHADLSKPRIELFRAARRDQQELLDWLNDSVKKECANIVQAPDGQTSVMVIIPKNSSDHVFDKIIDVRTRIRALDLLERAIFSTGPEANLEPAVLGPREANLVQKALLAGLGMLFAAIIFTLFINALGKRDRK